MSLVGQKPNPSGTVACQLSPAPPDIPAHARSAALCRYCCKSPKLPGANFSAVKKSDRRPPVDVASITLPRSPASLSSGDEVPYIFTRKSRVQPKEILIASAKRLLQQNLPEAVIPTSSIPNRQHSHRRFRVSNFAQKPPSELPIQAPVKFDLVINMKAAKALGLDVPWQLQQLADEVIE
jgi:hypothetical protein